VRDVKLGAVLLRGCLVSPPHTGQNGVFTAPESREEPPDSMMAKAKNRKTHGRMCHQEPLLNHHRSHCRGEQTAWVAALQPERQK